MYKAKPPVKQDTGSSYGLGIALFAAGIGVITFSRLGGAAKIEAAQKAVRTKKGSNWINSIWDQRSKFYI